MAAENFRTSSSRIGALVRIVLAVVTLLFPVVLFALPPVSAADFKRVSYNHPGLVVDLGVGLHPWPIPIDYDEDGDLDLVVSCPDKPYNGTYYFENSGRSLENSRVTIFESAVKIGPGHRHLQVSYIDRRPRILAPGTEFLEFREHQFDRPRELAVSAIFQEGDVRANQWSYADFDGDGLTDLIVGIGDWKDYGWDDAFNSLGEWTRGPLHGYVYVVRNQGTNDQPEYAEPVKIMAGGKPIDVYGRPSPSLADFDRDGDLDFLCGEFLDQFTYFENIGMRTRPRYRSGQKLQLESGTPLEMDLEMITPTSVDWTGDGFADLIVGDEDGRVALIEHTGRIQKGVPLLRKPRYFTQKAAALKFGALATPVSFDWDEDGDEDLIAGNSAGYIGFIENLDGGSPPRWERPVYLKASGEVIRIQAGPNGSIQGPAEAKWGYTTLDVADWDHDDLPDLVVNSIWGRVIWYRNRGTAGSPQLEEAKSIEVDWPGPVPKPPWNWWDPVEKELVTQWRTTPVVIDLNEDGLNDLVMLDAEGYLAFFERERVDGELKLLPPERVFRGRSESAYDRAQRAQGGESGGALRLNVGSAGRSGRRKFCFADWDGDGQLDLLVNSIPNINFLRNVGNWIFEDRGPVAQDILAGHTTSPTVVDWDRNGIPDLLVGAEDGHFYYLANPNGSNSH